MYKPKTENRQRKPKEHYKSETHKYLNVNLTNENAEKIKELAKRNGETMTSEINYIINDYFKRN